MIRSRRRLLQIVLAIPLLVLVSAVVYMVGMELLEGKSRSFWQALEWAGETLSTTGYGGDSRWQHPAMVIFVVALQFIGVFLVFLLIPIYLIPVLEERFEARLPTQTTDLEGHVVVYRHGPAVSSLLDELALAGVPSVVVEDEEGVARRLYDDGQRVVLSTIEDGALDRAQLLEARCLVANGRDDENAAVSLAARQLGFEGEILALVEEPAHRQPIVLAGASAAFTPRHMLGAALAARASRKVSPAVAGIQHLGKHLQVHEVRIGRTSPLAGKSLEEARVGERTGVQVIGQWVGGRLQTPASPEMVLQPDGILVVVGSSERIERFEKVCEGAVPLRRRGPFVVAGYGEVGQKVVQLLTDVGEEVRLIDRSEESGADIVGDVLDAEVLRAAEIETAQAVILALDSDSGTLFATVILKDLSGHVPVIARVNRAENVERIYRAGADFALSISQVAGQILATRLLKQEAIALDPQLRVVKVSAPALAGRQPSDVGIRERTGCSVVAVERGDELMIDLDEEFVFEAEDELYVCGSSPATRRFSELFAA